MNKGPIGIFDSGVGGLSIWNEIHSLLPYESFIYLADSKHAPYGERSVSEIIQLSKKNTELLLSQGCKLIVVACNTATTSAIDVLRETYDVPFVGIEPATKPAAIATRTKKIGILATKGTLASELFLNTSKKYRGDVEIIERVGTGLVPIIEGGMLEDAKPLLEEYLRPMIDAGVDNIVLGCSHYPFLRSIIQDIVGPEVNIIDSGAPVAKHTKRLLNDKGILNEGDEERILTFFTNGDVTILNRFLDDLGTMDYQASFKEF